MRGKKDSKKVMHHWVLKREKGLQLRGLCQNSRKKEGKRRQKKCQGKDEEKPANGTMKKKFIVHN